MIDGEFFDAILRDQVREMQLTPLSIQFIPCFVRLMAYGWSKRGTWLNFI